MDVLTAYLVAGLGFGLGLCASRYPALRLVGWVLNSYLGAPALVCYWVTSTTINTLQRALIGGLDEYGVRSINTNDDSGSSTQYHLVESRLVQMWFWLVCIAMGLGTAIGLGLCALGFRGFGGTFTWALVLFIYLALYGLDPVIGSLMGLSIGCTQVANALGIPNGPVIMVVLVQALSMSSSSAPAIQSTWTPEYDWFSLPAIAAGALAGILPGLNAEALTPPNKPELAWLAGLTAECVSLTVLLVQRNTSKTVLTTYLAQLNPDQLDLQIIVLVFVATLLVLSTWPQLIYGCLVQIQLPKLGQELVTVSALAGWINIPAQPFGSLLIAAGLYYGVLVVQQLSRIELPSSGARSISMAPLLIWS